MRRFDRLADNERKIREVSEEAELIARDDQEREGHRRSQEVGESGAPVGGEGFSRTDRRPCRDRHSS